MVLHVLSYPWKFGYYWDTEGGKSVPGPDSGDHENLWGLEGTRAENDFMPGGQGVGYSECFDKNPASGICVFEKYFLCRGAEVD